MGEVLDMFVNPKYLCLVTVCYSSDLLRVVIKASPLYSLCS